MQQLVWISKKLFSKKKKKPYLKGYIVFYSIWITIFKWQNDRKGVQLIACQGLGWGRVAGKGDQREVVVVIKGQHEGSLWWWWKCSVSQLWWWTNTLTHGIKLHRTRHMHTYTNVDLINVSILVVLFYYSFARCYRWRK